jgi:hypothetical protein
VSENDQYTNSGNISGFYQKTLLMMQTLGKKSSFFAESGFANDMCTMYKYKYKYLAWVWAIPVLVLVRTVLALVPTVDSK